MRAKRISGSATPPATMQPISQPERILGQTPRLLSPSSHSRLAPLIPLGTGLVASLPFQKGLPGLLVFVVLIPFLLLIWGEALSRQPIRCSFRTGWLFGLGFFLALLYWVALLSKTAIPVRGIAVAGWVAMCLYLALWPALFAVVLRLSWGKYPLVLVGPAAWGAGEYIRSLGFLGFPWGTIGYALADYLTLIQIARVGGVYLLSFLVVVVNILVAGGIVRIASGRIRGAILQVAVAVLLVFLVGIDGVRTIRAGTTPSGRPLTVALVQPSVAAEEKWTPRYKGESITILSDLTREAASQRELDLVVWPETSVPCYVRQEFAYYRQIIDFVQEIQVPLLFGFPDVDHRSGHGYEYYNSCLLLASDGSESGDYRKIRLVPFGERLPLHDRFDWVAALNLGEADFTPGREYTVFRCRGGRFSANICFESIFPSACRRFVQGGAQYLVNLTNDAWFGTTAAPYQHAAMARLRCVELGVYLARSANTGFSFISDPFGRVVETMPLFEQGVVIGEVVPTRPDTFYLRHGDWLPRAELIVAGLALLPLALAFFRRPGRGEG